MRPARQDEEVLDGVTIHRFRYAPAAIETLVQDGGILANLKRAPWKWCVVPFFFSGCLPRIRSTSGRSGRIASMLTGSFPKGLHSLCSVSFPQSAAFPADLARGGSVQFARAVVQSA